MFRPKTLIVLAGMVAALLVSAAPASAWWEATGSQWKGPVKVIATGEFADEGNTVKCPNATEIKATWSIQTKGEIKIHEKEGKQEQTKFGPHLHIFVKSWGKCKAELLGFVTAVAEVSECELQLVQQKGSLTATGGVVTTCVVNIPATGCTATIPPGMETQQGSNRGINVGLKEIELKNNGNNQVDKVNVTAGGEGQLPGEGILTIWSGGGLCPSTNERAELKGLEFEVEGANAI